MQAGLPTDRWKLSLDDYVTSAKQLLKSMHVIGFLPQHAVPIDLDGELLNGSHRVACALALEIAYTPVTYETRKVWAPPWDEFWFWANGMKPKALERSLSDLERLSA